MPRPQKTSAQLQATREKILDTAYAVLLEAGPKAISSRAIADHMGMSHMSLFTYFENQAAILNALRDREMSKWQLKLRSVSQQVQAENITLVMQDILHYFIAFARENPNLYRLIWVMPESIEANPDENRQRVLATVEDVGQIIKLGMERGIFEQRDPFEAAAAVLAMINTPFILFYSGKMIDPVRRDKMIEELFSASMRYLLKI